MTDNIRTAKIRGLNDSFRQTLTGGGTVLLTPGVTSLRAEQLTELLKLVRGFERFTHGNHPYGEHDFGAIDLDAARYFFKIDYYDQSRTAASPDPADQAVTRRVMTIMRAD
jgi:hypothetical protein